MQTVLFFLAPIIAAFAVMAILHRMTEESEAVEKQRSPKRQSAESLVDEEEQQAIVRRARVRAMDRTELEKATFVSGLDELVPPQFEVRDMSSSLVDAHRA